MKKILSVLLCLCLLLTAVSCAAKPPKSYEEQKALYCDVIDQYTALLTDKRDGKDLPIPNTDGMDEREADIATALHGIVNPLEGAEGAKKLGYGYRDMDGNGTPELLLLSQYANVLAILTLSGEKPILLVADYDGNLSITPATRNRLFIRYYKEQTDSVSETTSYVCRVEGDKITCDMAFGAVYDMDLRKALEHFEIVDGARVTIDEAHFTKLSLEIYQSALVHYNDVVKLQAPRIHFPLADTAQDKELPIADFSSYAAIRESFKAISSCLDQFSSADFSAGKYDHLFATSSDQDFETFIRLLYTAYHSNSPIGYDEIDLTGDGQKELVLLQEDYYIKAIFTQKDGKPLPVGIFLDRPCWLDAKGRLHVDRLIGGEAEWSLYEFSEDGGLDFVYSIFSTHRGTCILLGGEGGERLSLEDPREKYSNDYVCYPQTVMPNEYLREVEGLTYNPLTESGEDLLQSACGRTWYKSVKTMDDEDFVDYYASLLLNVVHTREEQLDLNFRHVLYTYSYSPDLSVELDVERTETTFTLTAHEQDGAFVLDGQGIKGRLELGYEYSWLIIEESTNPRLPVGRHCFGEDVTIGNGDAAD